MSSATTPDYIVCTGEFIQEWMDDTGTNAAELARRLDVSRKHVSELLSGKAALSHPLALALERVTGVPARIWNQYEAGYRSDLARHQEDAVLLAQYERATEFPLSYLRQHGHVSAPSSDRAGTVRQLLSLFQVADFEALTNTWRHGSVMYRRSAAGKEHSTKLMTWLALAERQHDASADLPPFDRSGLKQLLPRLRALTTEEPATAINEAITALSTVGVALCIVPAIPGLGMYGATRWLNGRPLIQLSLLQKTDDQFWFTLFHELGHVQLHKQRELYLFGDQTPAEDEADRFASDLLIPPAYADRIPRRRDLAAVVSLAEELGIAPSIVLGRTQRETGDFAWGHSLKRTVRYEPTCHRPPQAQTGRSSS